MVIILSMLRFLLLLATLSLLDARKPPKTDDPNTMIQFICESDQNCGGLTTRCGLVTIRYDPAQMTDEQLLAKGLDPDTVFDDELKVNEKNNTCVELDQCDRGPKAYDKAGPNEDETVYVEVTNCMQPTVIKEHWFWFVAAATVVLIIISFVFFLTKKQAKKPTQASQQARYNQF